MQGTAERKIRVRPSRPQFDILTSRKQINLFLAGQGSGKSFIAGILSGTFISKFPGVRGFIGANTYLQLSDSTLFRIRVVWRECFGWTEFSKSNPYGNYVIDITPPAHFNTEGQDFDSYHGKICFKNGTVIFKGSLENYKAHDGKEFAWAILDETKDTKEEAVKEVILGRLRQQGMYVDQHGNLVDKENYGCESFNPLYILTSPAKVPWINEWFGLDDYVKEITEKIYSEETYFRMEIDNKLVTISSAFHNKANLPGNFLTNQIKNLSPSLRDLLIYANPFASSGGEFYKCFSRINNVIENKMIQGKPTLYDSRVALHISFDFNVHPHMSMNVYQMWGKKIIAIDEFCLKAPKNTTLSVCEAFALRYHDHEASILVYGDPSGKAEDTRQEKGSNDFTIIMKALEKFHPQKRVDDLAPPVKMRGDFINILFEQGYEGITLQIGSNCTSLISDLTYGKQASDGTKLKEKVKDPNSNITFEKYHHCSDELDYFICKACTTEFKRFQKGGTGARPMYGKNSASENTYK